MSSPARCRLPTSCWAASREVLTNSSSCERRRPVADLQLVLERLGAARETRGDRQADADRIVDFMGDASDQAAERRQTFGVDQVLLGGIEFKQRVLRLLLRRAQLVFGLSFGDGVFAEHFHRARHLADLVPGAGALDLAVVVARCDRVHRRHDLLQGQADRERDQDAGGDDDAEEDHRDRKHLSGNVGERLVEGLLRLLLALAHLDRQFVDGAGCLGLARVDRVAQQFGAVGQLRRQFRKTVTQRRCPRVQPLQRHPLQIVVGKVDHHGNGLLDRLGVAAGLLGRRRGQGEIIGIGGDQHRRKGLAGFAERWPDQRIAVTGCALDDRIKPGHVTGRGQDLVLVGFGDRRLHPAQFAEAVEEALGDALEPLRPSRTASGRSRRAS